MDDFIAASKLAATMEVSFFNMKITNSIVNSLLTTTDIPSYHY